MQFNEENDWVPQLGMEFETEEQAWEFWNNYSGKMGFGARRCYAHKSRVDSVLTSSSFVCSNQGTRKKDKRDENTKNPRAETRTGCKVRLNVKFIRETNSFRVVDFVSDHNHALQKPEACYMIASQRKVTEVQQCDIDLADQSGIRPKQAYELMGRQVGGRMKLSLTMIDYRNYLRDKRRRILISGEAVAMLNYFNERTLENPSFQHVEQEDDLREITNIVWADAKMIADYARFGDVIAFDTTFGTNKEHRPFGVFVGFNHFREMVIFGATLMYDQRKESFEWVFKTFVQIHNHKAPKTIFTDQDMAMGKAIETVMPETTHGLCTWHIMENAIKHLACYNKNGLNILGNFSACMYEYEDEDKFEEVFSDLKGNVGSDNEWISFIYECRRKWAYCFMKDAFSLGMRSTQLSESINRDIKSYVKSDLDIIRLLENFERIVDDKRANEDKSDFDWTKKQPKIKKEYLLSWKAQIEGPTNNEFVVSVWNSGNDNLSEKCYKVLWDRANITVSCGCKKYERMGILCWHALKVLDVINIKILPEKYILKRWTREAKKGTVEDRNGRTVIEDTRLDMARRNRDLCRRFTKIASRAAHDEELTAFIDGALQTLEHQLEEKIKNLSITVDVNCEAPPVSASIQQYSDNLPRLKKKDGKRCSKRTPSRVQTVRKKIKKKNAHLEAKGIGQHNLIPTISNNTQLDHCISYTKLLLENSTFALPSSYFELIPNSQDPTAQNQEAPLLVD